MLRSVPLLLLIVALYNGLVFLTDTSMSDAVLEVQLASGAPWVMSVGETLIGVGLLVLYFEILKATRTSLHSVWDHAFSMALFVLCLLEFILVAAAGTGTFFLITVMTAVDVVAGFTVTISTARRDIGLGHHLE
jgi:hypothetical protein